MTFDEWFNSKQGEPYDSMYVFAKDAWAACSASLDAEVSRLVEKCHDFAAQHETDSGIIESDGKEIHFLREQRDEWKSRTEFSFGVRDRLEQERNQLREHVEMLRKHLSLAIIGLDESWEELNESRVELMRVAIADTEPK